MKKINKIFTFILLYLGISYTVYSQVSVTPLRFGGNNTVLNSTKTTARTNVTNIGLPISVEYDLNPKYWVTNNNIKIDKSPSLKESSFILVFDGADSSGNSYDTNQTYGAGDVLMSNPISLDNNDRYTKLSFYWQSGGQQYDAPDSLKYDSLVVSFLSPKKKKWVTASVIKSSIAMTTESKYAEIALPDSMLYAGFQFKIQSFGKLENEKDVWRLVHIKLDKNRPQNDSSIVYPVPFFDDFSSVNNGLNMNNWTFSGGVDVNNNKAINPPTKNVITFDGIDANGNPYNFYNPFAYGPCDSAISKKINLQGFAAEDSVYLQFYWQSGGYVEQPDSIQTDSISIFFKTLHHPSWMKAWTYTPTKDSIDPSKFNFAKVYIPDSLISKLYKTKKQGNDSLLYFEKDFQFKIQSFGNQSGAWDNWHIDFIKIDKFPITDNKFFSANTNEVSILKNYTSITKEQLYGFEEKEVKDSISFRLNNFSFDNRYISTRSFSINNNISSSQFILKDSSIKPMPDTFNVVYKINKSDFINFKDSSTISVTNFITNAHELTDDNTLSNDTAKISSFITNYLAYDDGSAEGAFGINQAAGRVLYKIKLNRPDTITAIDFAWVKAAYNVGSASFKLLIMKTLDSVKYSKQVLLNYSDTLNLFTRYKLDSAIILSDSFYIGYEQNSANILTLGFDKNTSSNNNILYAIDYKYGTNNYNYRPFTKNKGSLMLRPVFEKGAKTTIKRISNQTANNIEIYPNPSSGIIFIKNDTISSVKICNLLGKEISGHLYNLTVIDQKQAIETNNLDSGFYILYLYNKQNYLTTKKVFIQP